MHLIKSRAHPATKGCTSPRQGRTLACSATMVSTKARNARPHACPALLAAIHKVTTHLIQRCALTATVAHTSQMRGRPRACHAPFESTQTVRGRPAARCVGRGTHGPQHHALLALGGRLSTLAKQRPGRTVEGVMSRITSRRVASRIALTAPRTPPPSPLQPPPPRPARSSCPVSVPLGG
jgi:hypothetical protein